MVKGCGIREAVPRGELRRNKWTRRSRSGDTLRWIFTFKTGKHTPTSVPRQAQLDPLGTEGAPQSNSGRSYEKALLDKGISIPIDSLRFGKSSDRTTRAWG